MVLFGSAGGDSVAEIPPEESENDEDSEDDDTA
jgi:hypothetical protein